MAVVLLLLLGLHVLLLLLVTYHDITSKGLELLVLLVLLVLFLVLIVIQHQNVTLPIRRMQIVTATQKTTLAYDAKVPWLFFQIVVTHAMRCNYRTICKLMPAVTLRMR